MSSTFFEQSSTTAKSAATCLICVICDAPLLTTEGDERPERKKTEEEVCVTACGHVFHNGCLMEWLSRRETCPNCRHQLSEESVVPKLYFNSDTGEAAEFQKQYRSQESSAGSQASTSADQQSWYEKYKDELLLGGGALLGVIAGAVFTGLVSGSKQKRKN